jgi:hypothetical protein
MLIEIIPAELKAAMRSVTMVWHQAGRTRCVTLASSPSLESGLGRGLVMPAKLSQLYENGACQCLRDTARVKRGPLRLHYASVLQVPAAQASTIFAQPRWPEVANAEWSEAKTRRLPCFHVRKQSDRSALVMPALIDMLRS